MEAVLGFLGRAFIAIGLAVATLTVIFCFGQWIFNPTTTLVILCGLGAAFLGGYFLYVVES